MLSKGDRIVDEGIRASFRVGGPALLLLYTDLTSRIGKVLELLIELLKHLRT